MSAVFENLTMFYVGDLILEDIQRGCYEHVFLVLLTRWVKLI